MVAPDVGELTLVKPTNLPAGNNFKVGLFVTGGVSGKAVSNRSTGRSDFTFTPKINLKAVK